MTVLITGGSGKLGSQLKKVYPGSLAHSRREMDLTNAKTIYDYISKHKPDMVIHTAALTGIRECEEDKELAWKTNVLGAGALVDACLTLNNDCYFIYISTACVFYGDRGNYAEDDIPYPKNFYSLSKLLGEFAISHYPQANRLIVRTNFAAREKWPYAKAFTDRWGTYLFADDLAMAIKKIADQRLTGVVHICGKEKLSVFELAKITTPDIQPMTLVEYSGPPLTQDMSLISKRVQPFELRRVV